jgi:hypothetical protein
VNEPIFINQSDAFEDANHPKHSYALKLRKALYSIKQAPREWHKVITTFPTNTFKFTSCAYDPCLLFLRSSTNRLVIFTLFVDDITYHYSSHDKDEVNKIIGTIGENFKVTKRQPLTHILGMQVTRVERNGKLVALKQIL